MDRRPRRCPACGTDLRPDARSYYACGANLPLPGAPAGQGGTWHPGQLPMPVKAGLLLAVLDALAFCCPIAAVVGEVNLWSANNIVVALAV